MKFNKLQFFCYSVLMLFCFTISPGSFAGEGSKSTIKKHLEPPLVVGVFPRRNKVVTRKIYSPMMKYLSKKLNRKVIFRTPETFLKFWEGVKQNKYDLVHYNQYHYIVSHKKMGYKVIVRNKEFGSSTISASIIVRKDSGINSVEDLRGKKVVFGGSHRAMQSYIYARYLLEENALQAGGYIEGFSINPPNALLSVYYKKAEAAGVGDTTIQLGMVTKQIDTNKLKFLLHGKQLSHLPWAVNAQMSLEQQNKIFDILSSLHKTQEGRSVLKAAKLDQLVPTVDSDYDEHRKIVKAVLGESY